MAWFVNALLIAAVAALAIVRQFGAGRVDADGRWWVLPGILAFVALREPDLLGGDRHTASAAVLAADLLMGLALGAGWAWTTRIWVETDGTVWSKSTKASVVVWTAGVGLRAGLFACAAMAGVHQGSSALILALAATLLVRSGVLAWRVQSLHRTPTTASALTYGDGVLRSPWKEPV
ncbi:DUF1453 domain-containing protein [Streptomyces galilaeus]|uniref:DUF1453 domain-containing protein n=1 Tax=Streptomyces TaxID=1883 RepID=UPI00123CD6CF|nr:DUF1453 domain-containing protein [Streptomyces galilaeus]QEU68549.1 DUF1453 domain-containing protein [Streptomyces galilaeus]GGW23173.1 DUF1453 domain-containing protein [Streptomyces galilaeus]